MDRCQAVVQVLCALLGNTSIVGRVPKGDGAASLVESAYELVDAIEDGAYERVDDVPAEGAAEDAEVAGAADEDDAKDADAGAEEAAE